MQMNNYPLAAVITQMAAHSVSEFAVTTERHDKFLTCSFLGRKPG